MGRLLGRERDRVPGEGVEPSRAEAHGFLRPARLPIPPSRPGRPSVAARSVRAVLAGLLAVIGLACSPEPSRPAAAGPTIAFLYDGSPVDADLVSGPALAGLELAAHQIGGVGIEPVNIGLATDDVTTSLRELGEDREVLAAVIAPWTAPPDGAIELLAGDGVPVVTLSWAWGPPREGSGLWRSFVAARPREGVELLSAASAASEGASVCLAGDDDVTSRTLLATVEELGVAAGDPRIRMAGAIGADDGATTGAFAARLGDLGCPVMIWIGGAEVAASVLSSAPDPPSIVGTSRMKTDAGLELATSGTRVFTVCACVDIALSTEDRSQRFVHDLQAASGAPPGPFAVEAYDAGRLLIGVVEREGASRGDLAAALAALRTYAGLVEGYAFEADGSRSASSLDAGTWRAEGSRWLPATAVEVPGG